MGDERDVEPERGRRNPAVSLVVLLPERMARQGAVLSKRRVSINQTVTGPHDLRETKPSLEASKALLDASC